MSSSYAASIKGLILLPKTNRILEESLTDLFALEADAGKRPNVLNVRISDFDGVQFSLQIENESDKLHIGIAYPGYKEIQELADLELKEKYGELVADKPSNAQDDVSLVLSLDEVRQKDATEKKKLRDDILLLKEVMMRGALKKYFKALMSGKPESKPMMYNIRGDTTVYLIPGDDRVSVCFGIDFNEPTDKVIARVFMQELSDSKKIVRSAPPFKWSVDPPYANCKIGPKTNPGILGYATIGILKSHLATDDKMDDVIHVLINFRTFLQYHLKCAKSYFHSRMRAKCSALLKILNRAKVSFGSKNKKSKSGKTFTRKK